MHAHNKTQKTANENNGEKIGLYENKELTPSLSEATLKLHFSTDARKAMENKLFLIKKTTFRLNGITAQVTEKEQQFFIDQFLREKGANQ